jgi:hypothetical protein
MTPVNVPEWEWASQEYPPQFLARQLWRTAVANVAASAKRALPDTHHRIDQAVRLVLGSNVELLPNGTVKVTRQSDPKTVTKLKAQDAPVQPLCMAPRMGGANTCSQR